MSFFDSAMVQLNDTVKMLWSIFSKKKKPKKTQIVVDIHCVQNANQTYLLAKSCRMGTLPDFPCSVIYRERVLP